MGLSSRRVMPRLRVLFVALLLVLTVPVVSGYVTSPTSVSGGAFDAGMPTPDPPGVESGTGVTPSDGTGRADRDGSGIPAVGPNGEGDASGLVTDPVLHPRGRSGILAVTIDALGPSQLVAYGPDGSIVYQNRSYQIYHDVDPSLSGGTNVTYVASNGHLDPSLCAGESKCMINVVERVNLSTGNATRLYTRYSKNTGSTQIHDVDMVNESVLLVADIVFPDSVYLVDRRTGERIWQWNVSRAYAEADGGHYPNDWTHINDVEYLHDGRVMANLRNMDQVVFLDPGEGLQENWTLGEDDDHAILYEQHNADYIPRERGGPAVLVADSENNRVVEYQRIDGEWELSWAWSDPQLAWPRDADRLPNGNTLVVDSHGQRIFEVNRTGAVVAERSFPNGGYEAEKLGTGDESAGGLSMVALRRLSSDKSGPATETRPTSVSEPTDDGGSDETDPIDSGSTDGSVGRPWNLSVNDSQFTPVVQNRGCDGVLTCTKETVTDAVPPLILHGTLFVLPDWVTPFGGAAILIQILVVLVWAGGELAIRRERIAGFLRGRLGSRNR